LHSIPKGPGPLTKSSSIAESVQDGGHGDRALGISKIQVFATN
jgi:hypothetical protein